MIITRLSGGIGNQMFQYSLGRALALKNNVDLKLDISEFGQHSIETPRQYMLDKFNIKAGIAQTVEINRLKHTKIIYKISNRFGFRLGSFVPETFTDYDPSILKLKNNKYLYGFWQSYKYFNNIKELLLKDFTLINKPSKEFINLNRIAKLPNTLSVHIRRGDYVSNKHVSSILFSLPLSYYLDAMQLLSCHITTNNIFVFSDDQEWVKGNLPKNLNYIYASEKLQKPYEEILLMSACQHHIISNSTFGWWGAWLGENQSSINIAPKLWFRQKSYPKDLIPLSWKIL